ncbi:Sugar phosphate isomerase/epimerase [Lutibacter agarilyticus]|uniref:Sugar phosphate isomerase/epimerase n=1 Tax=Lutibacter agarilyticus TaxID=1109740 RepID=A0A238WAP5_9FLAO|nr:TIM barrel protein [Lutibacter agarilyticus]SNR43632.1 Sugar phosphate isomerase/epimerase [Lutibacter agarilyticus]
MNKLILALVFLIAIGVNSCQKNIKKNELTNPFFVYNFGGLENLTPQAQINTLKSIGYDGISLRMAKEEHIAQLNEFIQLADNTSDFKIYSVFVRYNFNDSEQDRNRWKKVVDSITDKNIALWFIFGKKEVGINDEQVENILRNVVNYSASKKVPVTLYPHSWCYFYSAEQSLPMVEKINHPNLKLALHTCHELKAGNGNRLDEVVINVKDYLSFVTIAGASKKMDTTSRRSMDNSTIMPLEDGDFDYAPFFKALKTINYKKPVGYINFGFEKEPEQYLPESLEEWGVIKSNYLNY